MNPKQDIDIFTHCVLSLITAHIAPPLGFMLGAKMRTSALDALAKNEGEMDVTVVKIAAGLANAAIVVGAILSLLLGAYFLVSVFR